MNRGQKHRFEFHSRGGGDKMMQKSAFLSVDSHEVISIAPTIERIHLESDSESIKLSKSNSQSKPRSGSLMVVSSSKPQYLDLRVLEIVNPQLLSLSPNSISSRTNSKRNSLLSPYNDLNSSRRNRASPSLVNEESQEKPRKFSYSIPKAYENNEDDIILMNVINKKKALEEVSIALKEKKNELSNTNAEIDAKQANLNSINKELQLKSLELQVKNSASPKNALEFSKNFLNKLEGIKEERDAFTKRNSVKLDINGFNLEIDATLEQLIPDSLDIISWKTGFNTGFEKGLSVGLHEGESLGIEVGEEQGLIKSIMMFKEKQKISGAVFEEDYSEKSSVHGEELADIINELKEDALEKKNDPDEEKSVVERENYSDIFDKEQIINRQNQEKINDKVEEYRKNIEIAKASLEKIEETKATIMVKNVGKVQDTSYSIINNQKKGLVRSSTIRENSLKMKLSKNHRIRTMKEHKSEPLLPKPIVSRKTENFEKSKSMRKISDADQITEENKISEEDLKDKNKSPKEINNYEIFHIKITKDLQNDPNNKLNINLQELNNDSSRFISKSSRSKNSSINSKRSDYHFNSHSEVENDLINMSNENNMPLSLDRSQKELKDIRDSRENKDN